MTDLPPGPPATPGPPPPSAGQPRRAPDNRARLRRLHMAPAPAMELPAIAMLMAGVYYWLLLLDNVFIRNYEAMSSYLDEISVLLAAPFAVAALLRPPHGLLAVFVGFGGYLAAGAISGLFSPVAGYPFALVTGLTAALDAKPFIMLLAFAYCLRRAQGSDVVTPFFRALIAIALINAPFVLRDLALNDGVSIFGEPMDLRAGIYRPHGLYHHAAASVDTALLATMAAAAMWGVRKTTSMALLCGFLALLTMLHIVAKEIVAVVLVLGIAVLAMRFRQRNTQTLVRAAAITAGILLALPFADLALPVIQGQVTDYVVDAEGAVRSLMYIISVELAAASFPLGSGLGTFGSLASYTIFYSPVYDQTGLALFYGASRAYPYYLQDVFWPKVLGESGWLGLGCYLGLVLFLTWRVLSSALRRPTAETLFAGFVLVTALVKSIAAPTFTSDLYIVALGLAMAVAACYPHGFGQAAPVRRRAPPPRPGPGLRRQRR